MNAPTTHSELVAIVQGGTPDFGFAELSDTALQIGRESVLSDKGLFSAWLDFQEEVREPSAYFGPVSTWELVQMAMFHPTASEEQRKAAREEVTRRYLEQESESVLAEADKASRA